ncbi:MAG TPA: hypothetical protein VFQ48_03215, partial [Pseudonocardiaceae bacterium]|nr:hypothetical protein [Pseudonocardiaceae bacterium]
MGRSRWIPILISFLGGIVCLALVATACVANSENDRRDGSGGGSGQTSARGDSGDGSYRAPQIP